MIKVSFNHYIVNNSHFMYSLDTVLTERLDCMRISLLTFYVERFPGYFIFYIYTIETYLTYNKI